MFTPRDAAVLASVGISPDFIEVLGHLARLEELWFEEYRHADANRRAEMIAIRALAWARTCARHGFEHE